MTTSAESHADDPIPALARRCWAALETLHVVAYFAPEPAAAYRALGLSGRAGYFASRSAPMGPVPAGVTVATFYVFAPALVQRSILSAWEITTPVAVLTARHTGVTEALHRVLGEPDIGEALELARTACAGLTAPGRPLYAGHAALPWPTDELLALWHAASLLREHRGDGHVATLLQAGLDPVEAIVTGGLMAGTTGFMRTSRGWLAAPRRRRRCPAAGAGAAAAADAARGRRLPAGAACPPVRPVADRPGPVADSVRPDSVPHSPLTRLGAADRCAKIDACGWPSTRPR